MKILSSRLWWPVLVWCSLTSEILGARSKMLGRGIWAWGSKLLR